jgi:hypothetical protein
MRRETNEGQAALCTVSWACSHFAWLCTATIHCTVLLLPFPWTVQLVQDVPVDADFVCDTGPILRGLIKGTSVFMFLYFHWLIICSYWCTDSCYMFQTFSKINQYYSGICTTNIVPTAAVCIHGSHDVHKVGHVLRTGDRGLQPSAVLSGDL